MIGRLVRGGRWHVQEVGEWLRPTGALRRSSCCWATACKWDGTPGAGGSLNAGLLHTRWWVSSAGRSFEEAIGRGQARNYSVAGSVAEGQSGVSQIGQRRAGGEIWKARLVYGIADLLGRLGWSPETVAELRRWQLQLVSYQVVLVLRQIRDPVVAYNFFRWATAEAGCKHDRFSYTVMMKILGEAMKLDTVKELMQEMRLQGCEMDTYSVTTVIGSLARAGMVADASDLFFNMKQYGCQPDRISFTIMLTMYAKQGFPKEATKMFDQMLQAGIVPDTVTYNSVLLALGKLGDRQSALQRWEEMKLKGIRPDKFTYGILMDIHAKAGDGAACLELNTHMKEAGFLPNEIVRNIMMQALVQSGNVEAAEKLLLDKELKMDWTSVNSLMQAYARAGNVEKCLQWFERMTAAGIPPTLEVANTLVAMYLNKKLFQEAKQFLELLPQWGVTPSLRTSSLILHSLSECEKHEADVHRILIGLTDNAVAELLTVLFDRNNDLPFISGWFSSFFIKANGSRRVKQTFANELMNLMYKMGHRQQAGCVWDMAVGQTFLDHLVTDFSYPVCSLNLQEMRPGTALVGLTKSLLMFKKSYCSVRADIPDWFRIITGLPVRLQTRPELSPTEAAVADMLASLSSPFSMDTENNGFVARGKAVIHWLEEPHVTDMLTYTCGLKMSKDI